MTKKQFLRISIAKGQFSLWFDPNDKRCCITWVDDRCWLIGKARIDKEGNWDTTKPWRLVRKENPF